MQRSRVINTIGLLCTGAVLVVVVVTKFLAGAWIAILAMGVLFVIMKLIHKHYATVVAGAGGARRRGGRRRAAQPQPRHRAGVQPAPADHAGAGLRRATRPDVLEAITVSVDDEEARAAGAQVGGQRRHACRSR